MTYTLREQNPSTYLVSNNVDNRVIGTIENDNDMIVYYMIGDTRARYASDILSAYRNLVNNFERNIARA